MSDAGPDGPSDQGDRDDPWTPDALGDVGQPTLSKGVTEVKEGASKFAHGIAVLLLAIVNALAAIAEKNSGNRDEVVSFEETEHGWVAFIEGDGHRSAPMPSRDAAFDDLRETVALSRGDLRSSESTLRAIEESEGELERGETISMADLSAELESGSTRNGLSR